MNFMGNLPELDQVPEPLDLNDGDMHEDANGNVIIPMHSGFPSRPHEENINHFTNLADVIPPHVLTNIINDLDMAIKSDDQSRQPWMQVLELGTKYQGLQIEKRDRPFTGASGVFSPTQMQATLSTAASIFSETMPPSGPAKLNVEGETSPEIEAAAEKWEALFNCYFTRLNKAFYPDFDEAVTMNYVPMGGVPFKLYRNPGERWPSILYIKPQDFLVNTSATSLHMADRITHVTKLTPRELILRQMSGLYRHVKDLRPNTDSVSGSQTNYEKQTDKLRGVVNPDQTYNPMHTLNETHVYIDLGKYDEAFKDEFNLPKPYIVTYDRSSKACLGFYNNWKEGDPSFKRKNCFVNATFIPGYGIYGIGYFHLLTGNAIAATALQRQMIDLGTASNWPGGIRKKGVRYMNSEITPGPGDFVEVDTGVTPLDEAFMPWPFPQPSGILMDLKNGLEENMMQSAGAATPAISETPANTPAMTVLAVLDKQEIIQSLVSQRMHRALAEMFEILYDLFKECLEEDPYTFMHLGKMFNIGPEDFLPGIKIVPVSDPKLSSFPKRAMTAEAILNTASQYPDMHNMYKVLKRYYTVMNVHNIDEFLINPEDKKEEPKPLDPVTENGNAIQGIPLKAFIFQDHKSHMALHGAQMQDQSTPQEAIPALQAHNNEHQAMDMMISMFQQLGMPVPEDPAQIPPEQQNEIAMMAAQIVAQQQQQQQEQAPLTPEQVMMEEIKVKDKLGTLEDQREREKLKLEAAKLDLEGVKAEQKKEFDDKRLQLDELKIVKESEAQEGKIEIEAFKTQVKAHTDDKKLSKESLKPIKELQNSDIM